MTSRLGDFVRINPPIFLGSQFGDDPEEFLVGEYTVLSAMVVTYREKVELASYQSTEVAQVCYTQWKNRRSVKSGPIGF